MDKHFGKSAFTPWTNVHADRDYSQYIQNMYPLFTEDTIGPSRALEIAAGSSDLAAVNNYVQSKLIENTNQCYWTNQTLSYMTKRKAGIQKVKLCAERYILDATAGCGGDTLNFALSPRVKHIISCEVDTARREMLNNVIKLYDLNKRITVLDEFDGSAPQDYAVYIDPPFENNNLSLLGEPIEDTVHRLITAQHTVWLHTPPEFVLNTTAWVYPLNKVKLYKLCINILDCRILSTL